MTSDFPLWIVNLLFLHQLCTSPSMRFSASHTLHRLRGLCRIVLCRLPPTTFPFSRAIFPFMHINSHKVTCGNSGPVRVKRGMSLRNDIIMLNLIYGKWRKEKKFSRKACARVCRAFFGANLSEQSICRSICYCK